MFSLLPSVVLRPGPRATAASALVLLLVAAASAGTVSSDPRCAGFTCPLDRSEYDPFPCETAGSCQQCLTGPVWEQRIATLNSKPATGVRPTDFHVFTADWATHEILQGIVLTLLREVLGYRPKEAFVGVDGSMDVICCTETLLHFEKWPSGRWPNDDGFFTLSSLPNGYTGGSHLFVPGYTAAAYPLATSYNAYKYLPEYGNIFPRGMSTNCTELILDPALGCVEGNYVCDTNIWTNTTCRQGRYIPPQCEADPTSCQEVFHADPLYDRGRFEALIKNTGLKFIVAYVGAWRLPMFVVQRAMRGEHLIFYWWQPDPLPAALGAQQINFDPNSLECEQAHISGGGDPTLSGFDCAYPSTPLLKLGRRADLLRDPALKHFFDSLQLTSNELNTMVATHPSAGGTMPPFNISCDWIQNNFDRWQSWITPLDEAVVATQSSDSSTLTAAIAAPVATIAAAVLVAAVVYALRFAARPNRYAPTEAHRPLAVAYLALRGFAEMHEADPERTRVYREFSDLVRRTARRSECHVAQKVGDFFVVVSDSAVRLGDFIDAASAACAQHGFTATMEDDTVKHEQRSIASRMTGSSAGRRTRNSTDRKVKQRNQHHDTGSHHDDKQSTSHETPLPVRPLHGAVQLFGHLTIGLHAGHCQIEHDDHSDTYEYRGQPLATCAALLDACADGQFLATDEFQEALMDGLNADCGLRLTVAGRRVERAAGPAIECLQYNVGGEVKHFEAAAPNAALESAVAAAEQATGLLARKRVTVAVVRFEELQAVAGRSGDAVTAANNALFERLTELVRLHRGHLHAAVGDLVVVSFNAARPTSEQARRGLRFCHDMVDALSTEGTGVAKDDSNGTRVTCGVAIGDAFAGRSPDGSVAVAGGLVQEAIDLEAVSRALPGSGVEVAVTSETEFANIAALQWVGLLPAGPGAPPFPRRGAMAASSMLDTDMDEWLYVLKRREERSQPLNDAFRAFAETGDGATALDALAHLPAADVSKTSPATSDLLRASPSMADHRPNADDSETLRGAIARSQLQALASRNLAMGDSPAQLALSGRNL